jgi:hypothetical protein
MYKELFKDAGNSSLEFTFVEYRVYDKLVKSYIERKSPVVPAIVNGRDANFVDCSLIHAGANHPALLRLMLALGGDVNTKNSDGHTPYDFILDQKKPNVDSIGILLDHGIDTANLWFDAVCRAERDVIMFLTHRGLMPTMLFSEIPWNTQVVLRTQIVMVALCTPLVVSRFHQSCWLPLDCLRLLYTYL